MTNTIRQLVVPLSVFVSTLVSLTAAAAPVIVSQFDPEQIGSLDAVGFDPSTGNIYLHDQFGVRISVFDRNGVAQFAFPTPGASSNDIDLDFAPSSINVGGTRVPANSLLVTNGDDSPETLRALDRNSGQLLASVELATGSSVGGAYHQGRSSFFSVDFEGADLIRELNAEDGTELNSFSPQTPASFGVLFGDVDVFQRTGELFVLGSPQNVVRTFSPDGEFLADFDLTSIGITSMSGIALDDATGTAWISSTSGTVFEVDGLAVVPIPPALLLLISALGVGGTVTKCRRHA